MTELIVHFLNDFLKLDRKLRILQSVSFFPRRPRKVSGPQRAITEWDPKKRWFRDSRLSKELNLAWNQQNHHFWEAWEYQVDQCGLRTKELSPNMLLHVKLWVLLSPYSGRGAQQWVCTEFPSHLGVAGAQGNTFSGFWKRIWHYWHSWVCVYVHTHICICTYMCAHTYTLKGEKFILTWYT